jgi:HEAT repeat protein
MSTAEDSLAALGDEHQQGFGPAMQWLVEHPSEARPGLRALLEQNDDGMATRRAFDVLGRIGNAEDVALLASRLSTARGTLAADAAHGLALHRDPAAGAALVAATESANADVVGAAASALGERKDTAARPVLERLLAHGDEGVRHRAKLALEELPR